MWLYFIEQSLDFLELLVIRLESVVDVSGFESNELWVFVVSIVDALMAAEVFASFVKRYKRLVSVLFASHLVVDCFRCFLNDGI